MSVQTPPVVIGKKSSQGLSKIAEALVFPSAVLYVKSSKRLPRSLCPLLHRPSKGGDTKREHNMPSFSLLVSAGDKGKTDNGAVTNHAV